MMPLFTGGPGIRQDAGSSHTSSSGQDSSRPVSASRAAGLEERRGHAQAARRRTRPVFVAFQLMRAPHDLTRSDPLYAVTTGGPRPQSIPIANRVTLTVAGFLTRGSTLAARPSQFPSGFRWAAALRLQLRGQPRLWPLMGTPHRVPFFIPNLRGTIVIASSSGASSAVKILADGARAASPSRRAGILPVYRAARAIQ